MFLLIAILTAEARDVPPPINPPPSALTLRSQETRRSLASPIDSLNLDDNSKAVLAAITIGSRESMSREMNRSFSAAGAAHVLSVSGFHVGVICGFMSLALSIFGTGARFRTFRHLVTIMVVWIFALITGSALPTIRAAVTITLYLSAQILRRRSNSYNNLCAAAFLMLIINPRDLFDIGFQLSFISVASIIFFQPRIASLIEVKNPILRKPWDWLALSIAAQAGVSFMCIYYFGQISTVFLPANLCLSLISTILIPVAILWMLLPTGIPMHNHLRRIVEFLTEIMVKTTESFAQIPLSTINLRLDGATTVFCYVTMLLGAYLWFGGRRRN